MKKTLKYLGFLILGFIILFLIVANFSTTESSLQCSGEMSDKGTIQPMTVYIKLSEYRWWVGLWSDSDASLNLEIPNMWVGYFGKVEEVGDQLQIYETYPQKILKGNFSELSKTLAIETPFGFFDGVCNDTN